MIPIHHTKLGSLTSIKSPTSGFLILESSVEPNRLILLTFSIQFMICFNLFFIKTKLIIIYQFIEYNFQQFNPKLNIIQTLTLLYFNYKQSISKIMFIKNTLKKSKYS